MPIIARIAIETRPIRICCVLTCSLVAGIGPRRLRVSPDRRSQPHSSSEMSFEHEVYVESSVESEEVIIIMFISP